MCARVFVLVCRMRLEGDCDPCAVPWRRLRVGVRSSFITPQGLCLFCTLRVTCQCKCPPGSRRLVVPPQESYLVHSGHWTGLALPLVEQSPGGQGRATAGRWAGPPGLSPGAAFRDSTGHSNACFPACAQVAARCVKGRWRVWVAGASFLTCLWSPERLEAAAVAVYRIRLPCHWL